MNPTVFIAPGPPSHSLFSNWSLFSDYLVDEVFWVSDDAHLAENRSFFNPGGKFCTVFCRFGFEFCKFASLRSMFAVSLSRTISLGQAFLLLKLLYWTRPQTRETLYIYHQETKRIRNIVLRVYSFVFCFFSVLTICLFGLWWLFFSGGCGDY